MSEEDYDEQLAKAGDFHGEICGGIAIGTKLAMYGLDLMGMELNQRHKNLIVFLEIDRCMADAVQAGEALRVSDADANKKDKSQETREEMIHRFRVTPPEELFNVEKS